MNLPLNLTLNSPLNFSTDALAEYANKVSFQRLIWPALDKKKLAVYLRRDDLASQHYSGNKFYKLYYNLQAALSSQKKAIVSFGGAYSNHIHSLAALGHDYGLSTVGIIRGYEPKQLSPTLVDAKNWGMDLQFLDHARYREKNIEHLQEQLLERYGSYFLIPEGGENHEGVLGCKAIGEAIKTAFDGDYTVCCAVGTGTTFAGIAAALPDNRLCLGFNVLKGEDTTSATVEQWLAVLNASHKRWQMINGFHHGGYAKLSPSLKAFMLQLEKDNAHHKNALSLEPVYTAKMLWGIEQLAHQDYWPPGSQIIAVHGGGIQGRRGFPELKD